ncbi:MAG: hypothetical protein IJ562_02290 [Prevotella sp.]|nr:hypothetical protein [Prevotella sp.]
MKKTIIVVLTLALLWACGNNKTRQTEQFIYDSISDVEQSRPDTVASSVQEERSKVKENSSTPISSSSASAIRSHKSSSNDNMRSFDPASEEDSEDNGMSRYMENYDDEGWD